MKTSMPKNDSLMVASVLARARNYKVGRATTVLSYANMTKVFLHGNKVGEFKFADDGDIQNWELSTCGWDTATTVRRLNALLHSVCKVVFAKFRIYNGKVYIFVGDEDMGAVGSIDKEEFSRMIGGVA